MWLGAGPPLALEPPSVLQEPRWRRAHCHVGLRCGTAGLSPGRCPRGLVSCCFPSVGQCPGPGSQGLMARAPAPQRSWGSAGVGKGPRRRCQEGSGWAGFRAEYSLCKGPGARSFAHLCPSQGLESSRSCLSVCVSFLPRPAVSSRHSGRSGPCSSAGALGPSYGVGFSPARPRPDPVPPPVAAGWALEFRAFG